MPMTNQDLEKLRDNASKAENLLKAMSNTNRLMILCSLIDQEFTVSELNEMVPLSQSALSQHLAGVLILYTAAVQQRTMPQEPIIFC